jgi:hypothetical protein
MNNDHPGVRPVVVQPDQPAPSTARVLPHNAKVMPFGLSANSVGLGNGGLNWRRVLFVSIPLTVVLAVAVGTWLFVRSLAALTPHTVYNSSFEYTFLFYRSSETVNLQGGSGLKFDGKAFVVAKPTSTDIITDCARLGTKWQPAFHVRIEGVEYPVCRLRDNVFLVTFNHGNTKHLFEISYSAPHAINTTDVKQIMESIKVALP